MDEIDRQDGLILGLLQDLGHLDHGGNRWSYKDPYAVVCNCGERIELPREEAPECRVTVGYDADVQAASWSCQCGAGGLVPHARPGMGERVARRLAGIYAERHERGEDVTEEAPDASS
jgi:hypothetical protein